MAKNRDPSQTKWPVTLDHCFARIILDNTVGGGQSQWDKVIKKPAVRHMSGEQLQQAISLGEEIKAGEVDLCRLDEISLQCRGKNVSKYWKSSTTSVHTTREVAGLPKGSTKGPRPDVNHSEGQETVKKPAAKRQSTLDFGLKPDRSPPTLRSGLGSTNNEKPQTQDKDDIEFLKKTLERIQAHPMLTPYRKRLYTALMSVPKGSYTTYAAMSDYLNSSARAVGSGMRNNPFAPDVPCHRVLAANGSIGGFNGEWGKDGKYASKKIELLRSEGVRFDGSGKVVGEPFRKLHSFEDVDR
ncbi:hypothetical protein LTR84_011678 [Exophiala bonariae]|uniref:Methylated-DNA--protein-cysteine methyltransferase n=1 Tax=Exophiala bonariae TaxID=1690606 RepID=A0AAV9NHQ2_9EURO|nr:hypothetical protein LTR84_011678 [Exophiala bonariae]